jgi:hypothetical protein
VLLNQAIATQAGINPTDPQCLSLRTLEGPMTPSQPAEAVTMAKGGVITAMVDRWEKAGYLRRVRGARDRRQVLVEIIWEESPRWRMAYYEPVDDALVGVLADCMKTDPFQAIIHGASRAPQPHATVPSVTPR